MTDDPMREDGSVWDGIARCVHCAVGDHASCDGEARFYHVGGVVTVRRCACSQAEHCHENLFHAQARIRALPLPHEVPVGLGGQVRPYGSVDPLTGIEVDDSHMAS